MILVETEKDRDAINVINNIALMHLELEKT